jgi:TPR repeat protein
MLATDLPEGRRQLASLAQRNSARAMTSLAINLQRVSPTNWLQAEDLFRQAYEKGVLFAFAGLAMCYQRRGEVTSAEAVFTEGARRGDALCAEWVAYLLMQKQPVEWTTVMELLMEAAAQGQVRAKMQMAHIILRGRLGVHQVPRGAALLVSASIEAVKVASRNPDDRLLQ